MATVSNLFVACLTRPMVMQQMSTHPRSWRLRFRETAAAFTLFPLVLLRVRIRSTRAPSPPWSIPSTRANDGASLWQHCMEMNAGWMGRGFLMLSLFVCRSHKTLAFCHYFSFTNCFYLLCILWKCTVCIDVGICFIFFCVELERMNWGAKWKIMLVCAFLMEPSSCWCCVSSRRAMMLRWWVGGTECCDDDGFYAPGTSACGLDKTCKTCFQAIKCFHRRWLCARPEIEQFENRSWLQRRCSGRGSGTPGYVAYCLAAGFFWLLNLKPTQVLDSFTAMPNTHIPALLTIKMFCICKLEGRRIPWLWISSLVVPRSNVF